MAGDLDSIAARKRLAMVGVAKNCGKTTTLNYLAKRRRQLGLAAPSLISIGIDGESKDVLLGTAKPAIAITAGQWVASAEGALRQSTATFEYVAATGFKTPLGEVLIACAIDSGTVLLAGLRHRQEVAAVVDRLAQLGPGPVWIDGAYGRVAGAHPTLSPAAMVSTGAVAGKDVADVVARTDYLLSRLGLPEVNDAILRQAIVAAVDERKIYGVTDSGQLSPLGEASAVVAMAEVERRWSTLAAIAIFGVVSNGVLEKLLALGAGRELIVPDGTVIHADADLWRRFRQAWKVSVWRPIEVVGLSVNPQHVAGAGIDAAALMAGLDKAFGRWPVFNPLQ